MVQLALRMGLGSVHRVQEDTTTSFSYQYLAKKLVGFLWWGFFTRKQENLKFQKRKNQKSSEFLCFSTFRAVCILVQVTVFSLSMTDTGTRARSNLEVGEKGNSLTKYPYNLRREQYTLIIFERLHPSIPPAARL